MLRIALSNETIPIGAPYTNRLDVDAGSAYVFDVANQADPICGDANGDLIVDPLDVGSSWPVSGAALDRLSPEFCAIRSAPRSRHSNLMPPKAEGLGVA